MSIHVLLDLGGKIDSGEVGDIEGLLLHHLHHVGLLEHSPADGRAVAALVAAVVLDVEDGLRVRGGDPWQYLDGGGAFQPVLQGAWHSGPVLRTRARAGDLPRFLDVALQGLQERRGCLGHFAGEMQTSPLQTCGILYISAIRLYREFPI